MDKARPSSRRRPRGQALHLRYEKAGLTLPDGPIPWNADAAILEVILRLPAAARQKSLFTLRLPGGEPLAPESLRAEVGERHRLIFRLPVPSESTTGELLWKNRFLCRFPVPVLTAAEFLGGLRLTLPTVAVRLGARTVAAQTFVASQCRGIVASCVVKSPVPLAPIAELGLAAVFRSERSGAEYSVPAELSSSQLASKEAVVTASPPCIPRRAGGWTIAWHVDGYELTRQVIHGIPARRFERSLRILETRFRIEDKAGNVKHLRQAPAPGEAGRLGPCFTVASTEPGMAGICRFHIHAVGNGEARGSAPVEHETVVTDGPTLIAPMMMNPNELNGVSGFELRLKNRALGVASLSPVPAATLTSEGGFKPPADFAWTTVAEDELNERLNRLINGG
jgi:hypothetical protein